jgi:DNA/RNA-binding domain of Phe-tRNA-synthetase-like protein
VSLTISAELATIVRPAAIWWSGAVVVHRESRLDPLLAEAESKVRVSPPAESAAVRTMYKRVGIDPTKTRPSNEALLRRVRKATPFRESIPRSTSSTGVRSNSSCRIGLYDVGEDSGNVTMRRGVEARSMPASARMT